MEAPLLQQTRYSDIDGSHVPWRQIRKYRCRCAIRLLSRDRVDYRLWSLKPGHWPFSDQFYHLANQNQFWSTKFTVHFHGTAIKNLQNV